MAKRAVIYIRTSSEQQGEKCSPVEQERDCRLFAEKQGLVVVNVYRDIERYRVKKKWVEPSGPISRHQPRNSGCQCSSARCRVLFDARSTLLGIFSL